MTAPTVPQTAAALSALARRVLIEAKRGRPNAQTPPGVATELQTHALLDTGGLLTDRGLAVRLALIAEDDEGMDLAAAVLGVGYVDRPATELAGNMQALLELAGGNSRAPLATTKKLITMGLVELMPEADDGGVWWLGLTALARERLADLSEYDLAAEALLRRGAGTAEGR
jgi:hypothetical protein